MWQKLIALFLVTCLFSCLTVSQPPRISKDTGIQSIGKPNIIYILADDLGYGDLSVYNSESKIKTPNIDQLARGGMRFTDAHSPSSVCTPTRYGILTGRYCWRSRLPQGVLRGYGRALLEADRITIADLLQSQGYRTGVVGKWHLGLDWVVKPGHEHALTKNKAQSDQVDLVQEMDPEAIDFTQPPTDGPLKHGFDYSYILPASLDMDPYCYLENDTLVSIPSEYTPGNDLNTGYTEAFWRAGKIAPGFEFDQVLPTFIRKAITFIETSQEPFFLYLPLAAPHTPWVPSEEFQGGSAAGTYGDFVQQVDAAVGQIMATLKNRDPETNTLIVFTSDNGPFWTPEYTDRFKHRAAGPLRGMKADAWEGGHRIPFIVKWPGVVAPGSSYAYPICLTDWLATCADITGQILPRNSGEDSYSLFSVLKGNTRNAIRPATIHHSSKGVFAIRQGDWKLILGRGSGGFSQPQLYEPKPGEALGQLYNLKEDLAEQRNLYQQHPEIVDRLSKLLNEYQQKGRSRE